MSSPGGGGCLPEPLPLYQHGGLKQEAAAHQAPPAASSYSNYPSYGGMPPPPPPALVMSRGAPAAAAGGPGAAALSPTYQRVSSTTHSDSDREGDIGKRLFFYISFFQLFVWVIAKCRTT
jgi:hypothetical protein